MLVCVGCRRRGVALAVLLLRKGQLLVNCSWRLRTQQTCVMRSENRRGLLARGARAGMSAVAAANAAPRGRERRPSIWDQLVEATAPFIGQETTESKDQAERAAATKLQAASRGKSSRERGKVAAALPNHTEEPMPVPAQDLPVALLPAPQASGISSKKPQRRPSIAAAILGGKRRASLPAPAPNALSVGGSSATSQSRSQCGCLSDGNRTQGRPDRLLSGRRGRQEPSSLYSKQRDGLSAKRAASSGACRGETTASSGVSASVESAIDAVRSMPEPASAPEPALEPAPEPASATIPALAVGDVRSQRRRLSAPLSTPKKGAPPLSRSSNIWSDLPLANDAAANNHVAMRFAVMPTSAESDIEAAPARAEQLEEPLDLETTVAKLRKEFQVRLIYAVLIACLALPFLVGLMLIFGVWKFSPDPE